MNMIISTKQHEKSNGFLHFTLEFDKEHSVFIEDKFDNYSRYKFSETYLSALQASDKVYFDLTDDRIPLTISREVSFEDNDGFDLNFFKIENPSLENMLKEIINIADKKQKDIILLYSNLTDEVILDDGELDDNDLRVPVYGDLARLKEYQENGSGTCLPDFDETDNVNLDEIEIMSEAYYASRSTIIHYISIEKIISYFMQAHSGIKSNAITRITDSDLGRLIRIFNRDENLDYINYLDKICSSRAIDKTLFLKANTYSPSLFTINEDYLNNGMKEFDTNIFLLDVLMQGNVFTSGIVQTNTNSSLFIIPCERLNFNDFEEISRDIRIIDDNKTTFLEYFMLTIKNKEFEDNVNRTMLNEISHNNSSIGYVRNKLMDFNQSIIQMSENVEVVEKSVKKNELLSKEQLDHMKKIGKKVEDVKGDTDKIINQNNQLSKMQIAIVNGNAELIKGMHNILSKLTDFEHQQSEILIKINELPTKAEQEQFLEQKFKEMTDNLRAVLNDNPVEADSIEKKYIESFGIENWKKLSFISKADMIASKLIYNVYKADLRKMEEKEGISYAPVIFPLLATLERELKLVFVEKLNSYCNEEKNKNIVPKSLKEYIYKPFTTLGDIPYIIGNWNPFQYIDEKGNIENVKSKRIDHFTIVSEFSGTVFQENKLNQYLIELATDIMTIVKSYRNRAVHGDKITKDAANECYDFTVRGNLDQKIESTLIAFLRRLKQFN